MKDHDTSLAPGTTKSEAKAPYDYISDDFDAASVFADPVGYLAGFGLRSELAETHDSGFPAAA